MKLIHIGLTKTGSTSLRRLIFPEIAKKFNLEELYIGDLPNIIESEINYQDKLPPNFIISQESLFSNSHEFNKIEESFKNLKKNFSNDANILIVLRNPYEFLNSIYLTAVHSLNFSRPNKYFYKSDNIKHRKKKSYNLSNFDYQKLVNLYKGYFKNVHIVKYEDLGNLNFLRKIFPLEEEFIERLKKKYNENYFNRSISKFGIITILFLSLFFNLKIIDSYCRSKIKNTDSILGRVRNKIFWLFLIREFFQLKFDKLIPYKKYYIKKKYIPLDIDKLNEKYNNTDY